MITAIDNDRNSMMASTSLQGGSDITPELRPIVVELPSRGHQLGAMIALQSDVRLKLGPPVIAEACSNKLPSTNEDGYHAN